MRGIARITAAPPKRKHPFRSRWLRRLVKRTRHSHDDPFVINHITLLCVGFYAALRRSELAALNVGDIKIDRSRSGGHAIEFAVIKIRRSKTDQTGQGHRIHLPATGRGCCPVFWLRRLLSLRLTAKDAPLFVSCDGRRIQPQFVADTVKDTVICVAPSHSASAYSGHSLRHGGLTALSLAGAPDMLVQKIARHKDPRFPVTLVGRGTQQRDEQPESFRGTERFQCKRCERCRRLKRPVQALLEQRAHLGALPEALQQRGPDTHGTPRVQGGQERIERLVVGQRFGEGDDAVAERRRLGFFANSRRGAARESGVCAPRLGDERKVVQHEPVAVGVFQFTGHPVLDRVVVAEGGAGQQPSHRPVAAVLTVARQGLQHETRRYRLLRQRMLYERDGEVCPVLPRPQPLAPQELSEPLVLRSGEVIELSSRGFPHQVQRAHPQLRGDLRSCPLHEGGQLRPVRPPCPQAQQRERLVDGLGTLTDVRFDAGADRSIAGVANRDGMSSVQLHRLVLVPQPPQQRRKDPRLRDRGVAEHPQR
ncbi:MAG: tyrosine-type recombinase/integrase [Salana multivorans]|nr:tyrosine-type recombinase/integrase [Salana multivorans]